MILRARRRALAVLALGLLASGCRTPARTEDQDPVPHDGEFAEGIDCANCHTPDGWQIGGATGGSGGFDHAATGFPLTGRHEGVGCVRNRRGDDAGSDEGCRGRKAEPPRPWGRRGGRVGLWTTAG